MNKNTILANRVPLAIFLISFVLYGYIAWCAPFTADDYEFSSYSFTFGELMDYVLHYGNGRLLGNIGTLLIINNRFAQILLKATMMSSIIILLPRLLSASSTAAYLCSFLLITGMSPRIFSQVVTWTSGFNNYTPPIFLTLIIANLYKDTLHSGGRYRTAISVAVLLLGISSQLFSEHTTLVNICIAFCALVCSIRRKADNVPVAAAWLVSTLLGGLVMFLIPKLFYVPGNYSDGYRSFLDGGIRGILQNAMENFSSIFDFMITNQIAVGILFIAAIITLTAFHLFDKFRYPMFSLALIFVVYYFVSKGFWLGELEYLRKILGILLPSTAIFLSFVVFAAAFPNHRRKIIFLAFLMVLSAAPLLLVKPIGERCLFLAYIFFSAILLTAIHALQAALPREYVLFAKQVVVTSICAFCIALTLLFTHIHSLTNTLTNHINREMANGADRIHVFCTPYNYTYGCTDASFVRLYYREEWGDIDIIVISMDEWMALYGADN